MHQPEIHQDAGGWQRRRRLRSSLLVAGAVLAMSLAGLGIASADSDGSARTTIASSSGGQAPQDRSDHASGEVMRHRRRGRHIRPLVPAAARALGVSTVELRDSLRSGRSIAQVARSKGVDVQKVVDALVAEARARLASAVRAGHLSQARADQKGADLPDRIARLVERSGLRRDGPRSGGHPRAHPRSFGTPGGAVTTS